MIGDFEFFRDGDIAGGFSEDDLIFTFGGFIGNDRNFRPGHLLQKICHFPGGELHLPGGFFSDNDLVVTFSSGSESIFSCRKHDCCGNCCQHQKFGFHFYSLTLWTGDAFHPI